MKKINRTLLVVGLVLGLLTVSNAMASSEVERRGRNVLDQHSLYEDGLSEFNQKLAEFGQSRKLSGKVLTMHPILSQYLVSLSNYRDVICYIEASFEFKATCVSLYSKDVVYAAQSEDILDPKINVLVDRL